MDSYPVTDALLDWLDRNGLRGNGAGTPALHGKGAGCTAEGTAHPATAQREGGETRADMNSGKMPRPKPRQVGQGRNVNNSIGGEVIADDVSNNRGPFPNIVDDTMAAAMSNGMEWRVVRAMPLLMIANCRG